MKATWPVGQLVMAKCPVVAIMVIALTISFVGCSKPALDKSLLTNNPCAPPCWNNLIPGESTEEDVRRELWDSSWVRHWSIQTTSSISDGKDRLQFTWRDRQGQGYKRNSATVFDGHLVRIEIRLDYELTFEEVVKQFGPPEGVHAHVAMREHTLYSIYLYYPSRGLLFERSIFDPEKGEVLPGEGVGTISSDFLVTKVVYYVPNSLEGFLRDTFLVAPNEIEEVLLYIQPWEGFGEMKLGPNR